MRASGTWLKGTLVATSTTFVLANEKVGRRSGQIRLHGPEDFGAMIKAETEKWEKVVKYADIKIE